MEALYTRRQDGSKGRGQLSLSKNGLGDSRDKEAGWLEVKGWLHTLASLTLTGAGGA